MNSDRNPERMKKTMVEAQTMAFTSQLFYFTMVVLVSFILYQYESVLWINHVRLVLFAGLIIVNAYLLMTTGKNPGFEPQDQVCSKNVMMEQTEKVARDEHAVGEDYQSLSCSSIPVSVMNDPCFCDICKCLKKLRTKHCFRCGRCVRKYDHHCPWIGACVGQMNHLKFVVMLFFQTVQAVSAFFICFDSMRMHEYVSEEGDFGQQFGVFAIFACFMFLYVVFVGGLFGFHLFLVLANTTTNELMSREKVRYLDGIKGNPFNEGPFKNFKLALFVPEGGHQWKIPDQNMKAEPSWVSKIFVNQYYHCC